MMMVKWPKIVANKFSNMILLCLTGNKYIYIYIYICERTQKFPELLKKIYLKYLYKFETLVPFKVLPLWLDAAIPALLPMLETLSKIFNGNAVEGHQQFSLNLRIVSRAPSSWLKPNGGCVSPPPPFARRRSLRLVWFPWMKQDLKVRQFADIAEVQRESLAALDSISVEDFRQCFQHWEQHWDCCIQLHGEYFEGD